MVIQVWGGVVLKAASHSAGPLLAPMFPRVQVMTMNIMVNMMDMMVTMVVVDLCMFPRVQVKIQFCFLFPCFDSRSSSGGLLPSDWLESVLFTRLAERASKIYIL